MQHAGSTPLATARRCHTLLLVVTACLAIHIHGCCLALLLFYLLLQSWRWPRRCIAVAARCAVLFCLHTRRHRLAQQRRHRCIVSI